MIRDEIEVFGLRLIATKEELAALSRVLSDDEARRAKHFRFERHRTNFVVGRGILRTVLAFYLGLRSSELVFKYGPQGKPTLQREFESSLHFNVAHSEDCFVCAFTNICELGVDLEAVKENPDLLSIAKQFFATREYLDLLHTSPENRTIAFYNCWTRKEAYLKAKGKGLSLPLHLFRVSLAPGEPPAFLNLEGDPVPASQWTLFHLAPFQSYIGALAAPCGSHSLSLRSFETVSALVKFLGVRLA